MRCENTRCTLASSSAASDVYNRQPEVLTNATADMAFALLLDSLRRISEGDRIIRKGKWKQIYGAYDYVGLDLQSKTLGIIGLGRIGKILAKRAKAFDMKIIYHNRKQILKTQEKKLGVKYTTFDKLITQSDIISVHVPHTKETNQMFNMKIFKKMKKVSLRNKVFILEQKLWLFSCWTGLQEKKEQLKLKGLVRAFFSFLVQKD